MSRYWLAVASADHVLIGLQGGFMQVCHGKQAPLQRIQPSDWVVYYSPTQSLGQKARCQCFTAIGQVKHGTPYRYPMSEDFHPWRRDVAWCPARQASITPLLQALSFSQANKNWGYCLRFGLIEITAEDMQLVAEAMGAVLTSQTEYLQPATGAQ